MSLRRAESRAKRGKALSTLKDVPPNLRVSAEEFGRQLQRRHITSHSVKVRHFTNSLRSAKALSEISVI